jgi:hypothetical protein
MRRIEVAPRHSEANQCCALEPAKYFYNSISTSRKCQLRRLRVAVGSKPDSGEPAEGAFMSSRPRQSSVPIAGWSLKVVRSFGER